MGEAVNLNPSPREAGSRRRPWRPGAALWLSAAIHLVAVAALLLRPQSWALILAVIVLNHIALGVLGLLPRSRSLGENMLRLPAAAVRRNEISLTFDDGPHPDVTPKVLDILDTYQAKASFFVIADKAAAHPGLVREIVSRGHSVENHSRRHAPFFGLFSWSALRRDVGAAQQIIAGITGRTPDFFRAPMGFRNPLLDPVITSMGLHYISWTRRGFDTLAPDPQVVLKRLARNLKAGDILLLHDRPCRNQRPIALEVLPLLLDKIVAAGLKPVSLPQAMK